MDITSRPFGHAFGSPCVLTRCHVVILECAPVGCERSTQLDFDDWALEEMFAGVSGQGAVDAWFQQAMDIEQMLLDGTPFCGGTADIHKFFDQIIRELVYTATSLAGKDGRERAQAALKIF